MNKLFYPYDSPEFLNLWELWKQYKKEEFGFKYKSKISEQAALKKLARLSANEREAMEIINQSMENGWKGHFKLTKNYEQQTNQDWVGQLNAVAGRIANGEG